MTLTFEPNKHLMIYTFKFESTMEGKFTVNKHR